MTTSEIERTILVTESTTPRPAPGPEHTRLDVFVGTWTTRGRTTEGPDAPATEIVGTDAYEWFPGGFFLVHRVDVRMGDEHVDAIELIGYDAASEMYPMHAYDNGGGIVTMQGSVDAAGTWTFATETERAMVVFGPDGRTMTAHWERTSDGSGWKPWMEVDFTREA